MNENESFSIPSVNVIQSSFGYTVEILGRHSILYKEDELSLEFYTELATGETLLILYKDHWKSLNTHQPDKDVIQRITDNIREAFLFRGIEIGIV